MLNFFAEHWFIEAIACIAIAFIIMYGLCWMFNQCERKD
jgi:hypothetical protein